jgi:hypothetical protein
MHSTRYAGRGDTVIVEIAKRSRPMRRAEKALLRGPEE